MTFDANFGKRIDLASLVQTDDARSHLVTRGQSHSDCRTVWRG